MTTLKARYSALETGREPYLRRARAAAEHTLPMLIPQAGTSASTNFKSQYQSVGAHGVTNLSAKLLMALLPPGHPFFKLDIDKFTLQEIAQGDEKARAEFDKAMSDVEQSILSYIEASPLRTSTFETNKHLLVAGNVLVYKVPASPTGDVRVYDISKYVAKRDTAGNLLECILREAVSPTVLPPEVRAACDCADSESEKKDIELYTGIRRIDGKWQVTQEINELAVPGASDTYPLDKCPWLVLRLQKIDGEDYGRGYVEEFLGDLISLEGLMKAIVKGSAAAAKVLFFVKPNSVTRASDCNKAASGDFVTGNADDITTLGLDKFADFRVALETIDRIEKRLGQAFMLSASAQRDAERVTAEEVRYVARELDDALGGIYSILAQEFQLPLIKRIMVDMTSLGKLPELPEALINPVIVTGMDALGRTADLAKLDNLVKDIFALSPELANQYVDISNYIKRRGAYLRIDTDGLINSQEKIDQANQQAQMEQMMQQVGPQMLQAATQQQ